MDTPARITSCLIGAVCLVAAALMVLSPLDQRGDPRAASLDAERGGGSLVQAADKTAAAEQEKIDFAREVLPILSNHCLLCHGPDQDSKDAKAAGFRLDLREEAVDFGMIVPGDPDASPVIDVLETTRASRRMPPIDSVKPQLRPEQVEVLRRWIAQGAEYTDHWAFVKPTKPQPPTLPNGADQGWASSDIDLFILDNLLANGLTPNPPADRHRLVRRVYLDLIGLPPTPEQAQAFVSDPSPDAFERVVDELLASEHFGEHWARQWLDKARYADSQGFEKDRPRTMWRYRDWVINAYNQDMPFDQFTIEQIAGDLLPDPTVDQLIATGFHRNTMTNTEGGTDDEEFRVAAVIDRVNTTGEVWLGVTMACVQCHTHKYDPIFHDEYFQFYAFFNQTEDRDRNNDAPFIKAPTAEQQAKIAEREKQLADAEQALKLAGGQDVELEKKVEQAKQQLEGARKKAPTALIMKDLPEDERRETYLFHGGSFLAPDKEGGIIEPGTPAVLHDFPTDAPKNRIGLAQWLIHEDNPLTARVQVNRIWEQLWGIGLVETTEDFGFQGSYPSNKQLLDYLAVTYQQDLNWSTKSLIKMFVMTSAYRQSGLQTAEHREIDPYNRLMSRGPRMRLSAEQIRDQALAVSGLLDDTRIGGPSVTPYMPGGQLPQAFDGYVQQESAGKDLHRRGVYTFWRRTAHYASFAVFDAPARDICISKRSRTNTPLQAFVTLNDPVYLEAAQALARRMITEAGDDLDARLKLGMRYALAREPSAIELDALRTVYRESLVAYEQDKEAAITLATKPVGPLPDAMAPADAAAMTLVGNVLLNLDELINKP